VTAREIAEALSAPHRPIRIRRGFLVPCPAHRDKKPSLSITDSPSGGLWLHCFAGCSRQRVTEALRERGLLPPAGEPKAVDAERRRQWQQAVELAETWKMAAIERFDEDKKAALAAEDWTSLERAARLQWSIKQLTGRDLVKAYQRALRKAPETTRQLVRGRLAWLKEVRRLSLLLFERLAEVEDGTA